MPRFDFKAELPKLTTRKLLDIPEGSHTVYHLGWIEGRWHEYASGYENAADIIVDRLVQGRLVQDAACLAAVFLYRHSVELSLKGMLVDADELLEQDDELSDKHFLVPLWTKLRKRMAEIGGEKSTEWLDRAEAIVRELDALDSKSFTYRYPVDNKGAVKLAQTHAVDIVHFRSVVKELHMILDGCAAWLGVRVDFKREMAFEF